MTWDMQLPVMRIARGVKSLPRMGDGQQSGKSDSPSILNALPESAVGCGLAWVRSGDVVRVDLNQQRCWQQGLSASTTGQSGAATTTERSSSNSLLGRKNVWTSYAGEQASHCQRGVARCCRHLEIWSMTTCKVGLAQATPAEAVQGNYAFHRVQLRLGEGPADPSAP